MLNLKEMVQGELYINQYSSSEVVYTKGKDGRLWHRDRDFKRDWKLSKACTKRRNYIACKDYGYRDDGVKLFIPDLMDMEAKRSSNPLLMGLPV